MFSTFDIHEQIYEHCSLMLATKIHSKGFFVLFGLQKDVVLLCSHVLHSEHHCNNQDQDKVVTLYQALVYKVYQREEHNVATLLVVL